MATQATDGNVRQDTVKRIIGSIIFGREAFNAPRDRGKQPGYYYTGSYVIAKAQLLSLQGLQHLLRVSRRQESGICTQVIVDAILLRAALPAVEGTTDRAVQKPGSSQKFRHSDTDALPRWGLLLSCVQQLRKREGLSQGPRKKTQGSRSVAKVSSSISWPVCIQGGRRVEGW